MKTENYDRIIALAGNPNVGKSTLFNELTGAKQHTGNWTGKTVELAYGIHRANGKIYRITDLPGTYSLLSRSPEEEVTRRYIMSGEAELCCVVCDATCLERNLSLVLQIMEQEMPVLLVLNLQDEAEKYGVRIDTDKLSALLGIPVVYTSAKRKKGMKELSAAFDCSEFKGCNIIYDVEIEYAMSLMPNELSRFEKLSVLSGDRIYEKEFVHPREYLFAIGYYPEKCAELICAAVISRAEEIAAQTVTQNEKHLEHNRKIDKLMTGRFTALPMMLLLLCAVLFITVIGANYPSQWLSSFFFFAEGKLNDLLLFIELPSALREMLVYGLFRVTGWVIAVMLPPMAIFFPLFTLLEDAGFLPRIAFNMDGCFRCAGSCGKQSLTMCMGFGCNAVGVCGCRIIDSPRERLIAILTNVFVPCNGRFPTLITLISAFLVVGLSPAYSQAFSAVILSVFILFGIAVSVFASFLLSKTVLRGIPSSFTLELPPYRMPNIPKVLIRSFSDRTLFVLGRAVCVAAPAGVLIWLMANINVGASTLLVSISAFLDPFASFFGLDGVILLSFILGFPANEIVLPLILMGYNGAGVLNEFESVFQIKQILVANGWDTLKCISVIIFCICHFPCSTTLLTVKKETGSLGWTFAAFIIPTLTGLFLCLFINTVCKLF